MNKDRIEIMLNTLNTLRKNSEIAEVRILGTNTGTVYGYYDNYIKLVENIKEYVGKYDIYVTLNPVKKDLLARCNNHLNLYAKKTTSDNDVERIRYILIDLDTVRPSGISSTDQEKSAAYKLLLKIIKDLLKEGLPQPIVADSGNGYHLLLPVDLENTEENKLYVKEFLEALDFCYSTDQVQVDLTTFNPARIVKFYGTIACKGDHTNERPHRWTKIIKDSDEKRIATLDEIKRIVLKKPKIDESALNKKQVTGKTFDVDEFINKHGMELKYKAPFHNKGTKYILKTCPWDSSHSDNSAYIIKFDNGGISAGCHHNSCENENWRTLRERLEPNVETEESDDKKMTQSDIIMDLTKDFQFLVNEMEEPHAAVNKNGHWEVMNITDKKFKNYITNLYYEKMKSAVGSDALKQALNTLESIAVFSENEIKLKKRIAKIDDSYYYDLCDNNWRTLKIDKNGCMVEDNPPILFTRIKNMEQQMVPDFKSKPEDLLNLVKKHFRFTKESDTILFAVYLVSCFLPQIAHVILVLYGEKGAAKSTTMRMVKKIVDPAKQDVLSMPTSIQNLVITLSNSYMPCFDNLTAISAEKSDLLCMAATGGTFIQRTLYTNSDETILSFKRCVVLNGINIVATRPDLLDRSIVLELARIPKEERKTEKTIWEKFDEDVPKYLGAIFNTISKAINLYNEEEIKELGRMADFNCWGSAIAEAMGIGGEIFREAYKINQDTANEEALSSNPVAAAVVSMMKNAHSWSGSVSSLLRKLESVAVVEHINTNIKTWPHEPNVLSRRLKDVKSNLEEIGITYNIRNNGDYKKIIIENHKISKNEESIDISSDDMDEEDIFVDFVNIEEPLQKKECFEEKKESEINKNELELYRPMVSDDNDVDV